MLRELETAGVSSRTDLLCVPECDGDSIRWLLPFLEQAVIFVATDLVGVHWKIAFFFGNSKKLYID